MPPGAEPLAEGCKGGRGNRHGKEGKPRDLKQASKISFSPWISEGRAANKQLFPRDFAGELYNSGVTGEQRAAG